MGLGFRVLVAIVVMPGFVYGVGLHAGHSPTKSSIGGSKLVPGLCRGGMVKFLHQLSLNTYVSPFKPP